MHVANMKQIKNRYK